METILTLASIERFHSTLSAEGRSPNTTRAYQSDLINFLSETGQLSIPMEEFELQAMMWLNQFRETLAPKTTSRRLTSLRAYGRWAGIQTPLERYVPPKSAETIPHPLPEGIDGVYKLIEVARGWKQKSMVAMCGLVGCRISESLSVRPMDFHLSEQTVTIRGKGDKTRIVPVSTSAWEVVGWRLVETLDDNPRDPFCYYQDRFARKMITDFGVRAGLRRHISSHDLRATFATDLLNKGANIRVVQELLGHASVGTTEIYTGVRMDQMRSAVELT